MDVSPCQGLTICGVGKSTSDFPIRFDGKMLLGGGKQ